MVARLPEIPLILHIATSSGPNNWRPAASKKYPPCEYLTILCENSYLLPDFLAIDLSWSIPTIDIEIVMQSPKKKKILDTIFAGIKPIPPQEDKWQDI